MLSTAVLKALIGFLGCVSTAVQAAPISTSGNLITWTHTNPEYNDQTPVADDKVRASTYYSVQVTKKSQDTSWFDSFTYMSIPRGGRDKWGYSSLDGAEFARSARLSMSWNSFLYKEDVWVEVTLLKSDTYQSVDDVVIRPTTLNLQKVMVNNKKIRIMVPYTPAGQRFSVEFKSQLYTTYNDNSSGGVTMPGEGVPTENSSGNPIHTEPRNSLMIFAESILSGPDIDKFIPNPSTNNIYYPPTGQVNNLNTITQSVIYFRPGTYYMPWNYHAYLPTNVQWVYIAPGAHIKGAFQFRGGASWFKVTGFGVLSGEKYVYEPDTANGYQHKTASECHGTCVKMLQFAAISSPQHLDLHGITVSDPPYHSFVVYGDEDYFGMYVSAYKQTGSWYWQTDGIELYKGTLLENCFFHANDDVLKIYHSDVTARGVVIWKNENGPVIQWGWTPRSVSNVLVDKIDIIHNRIWWKDIKVNTCIINSSPHWENTSDKKHGDPNMLIKDITMSNIRSEGMNPCSIRIHSLSSMERVSIKNLWIESWNGMPVESQVGLFMRYESIAGQKVNIGVQTPGGNGLAIDNYQIGGTKVTKAANNWQAAQLGRLGFDAEVWNNWDAY